jgi:hypothetical protein
LPGSAEKIAILSERARLKQSLFHPDDARIVNGQVICGLAPAMSS